MWDTNQEQQQLQEHFYRVSKLLKETHQRGGYIQNLTYPLKEQQILSQIEKMPKGEEASRSKENIYELAVLMTGVYFGNVAFLQNPYSEERRQLLAAFEEQYTPSIPKEDVPYLKNILDTKSLLYYHDYVDYRNRRREEDLGRELGPGSSTGASRSYVKRTDAGKGYGEEPTKLSTAAFINIMILPGILFAVSLIAMLVLYLGKLR